MSTIREQIADARAQELLTVTQTALLLQMDPNTVYRKFKKGQIPGLIRFGRTVRFAKSAILGFAKQRADERIAL